VAVCFCVAVAGCGSSPKAAGPSKTAHASSSTKAVTATPRPTAATPELTSYAQLTQPVVRSGIIQVNTLLKAMSSTSTSQLGLTCVKSGGDLSSNRDAFTSIPAPTSAKKFYGAAKHAYSITLGATDECGIAADSNSSSAVASSEKDLRSGLGELTRTLSTLNGWASKH
jgi:hypothetical protein